VRAGRLDAPRAARRMKALAQWKKHCWTARRMTISAGLPRAARRSSSTVIDRQLRRAVDPKGLRVRRHDEEEPDLGIGQDVLQAEESSLLPLRSGNQQRLAILDDDEAWIIALGRGLLMARCIRRREHEKGRAADEIDGRIIELAQQLYRRHLAGIPHALAQRFLRSDAVIRSGVHAALLLRKAAV